MSKELERDRQIDPLQLDVEVTQQTDLFYKWSERMIEARADTDYAKARMETVEAELQLLCRKDPSVFDLDKTTEPAIKAAVITHPDYIKARDAYFESKRVLGKLEKATAAMEMKKRMLESLITLHGQQYFAGPSTPRDLGAAWMLQKEQAAKRVGKKQRMRVRKRNK